MGEQPPYGVPPPWGQWGARALYGPPPLQHGQLPADGVGRDQRPNMVLVALVALVIGCVLGGAIGGLTGGVTGRRHGGSAGGATGVLDPRASIGAVAPSIRAVSGPGSVATIAATVLPSVVTVQVRNAQEHGTGAGVIIRSDGYILTNNHVVAPAVAAAGGVLTVDLSAARTGVPARVVGRSPTDDLAVIKIDVSGLRAARLGRSSVLRVGDLVVAVGAPLGLSGSVSSGIVSALQRNVDVPDGTDPTKGTVLGDAIQTDAAINPGNSGGALADDTGAVVGINSAIASTSSASGSTETQTGSIGVGFAIPIDYARSVAQEIIRSGRATHPYIGVVPNTIDPDNAEPGGPQSGAYLQRVQSGTPAERAGLRAGDVVTALDGSPVTGADDLIVLTRQHSVGETITLTYLRGGGTRTARVTLAKSPND